MSFLSKELSGSGTFRDFIDNQSAKVRTIHISDVPTCTTFHNI